MKKKFHIKTFPSLIPPTSYDLPDYMAPVTGMLIPDLGTTPEAFCALRLTQNWKPFSLPAIWSEHISRYTLSLSPEPEGAHQELCFFLSGWQCKVQ